MTQSFGAVKGFGRRGAAAPSRLQPASFNPVNRSTPRPSNGVIYLEDAAVQAVMREFEVCVTVLVIVMSVMNRPEPERVVSFALSNLRQPVVTHFPALYPVLEDHGMPQSLINALDDFHRSFNLALPSVQEITNDMPGGFDRGWIVEASLTFFAAAQSALIVMSQIPFLHQVCRASEGGLAPAAELEADLRAAANGDAPFWGADGPKPPAWQIKRNAARQTLNSPGVLSSGEAELPVVITDVSRLGFGIVPEPDCGIGSAISVALESGRILSGVLKWKEDGRAGAAFLSPLTMSDPLIAAS